MSNKTSQSAESLLGLSLLRAKRVSLDRRETLAIALKYQRFEQEWKVMKMWAELILKVEPNNAMALEIVKLCEYALSFDPLSQTAE